MLVATQFGSFRFVDDQNKFLKTFIMSPKIDDFSLMKSTLGDAVYGRKMDFCWLYDTETTDCMNIWVKKRQTSQIL